MDPAEKSCGPCTVCCKELTFRLAGQLKPAGMPCRHMTAAQGCAVYATRETVCRTYFCGWRHLSLGEDWRPDCSRILISFREGPAPDGKSGGIDFELLDAAQIAWPPLVAYIATLIHDGDAVFLSLPGGVGRPSPWVYLSDLPPLQDAVARRHFADTVAALKAARQICLDYLTSPQH